MCVFPFTAQAREHFGRKTESVDYIAVVRITITITITITMLRSAPRRIVTGPQPDAMMPSTMIRTTRHDTSRQVAFASCAAGDQLTVAGSAESNSLTRKSMDLDRPPPGFQTQGVTITITITVVITYGLGPEITSNATTMVLKNSTGRSFPPPQKVRWTLRRRTRLAPRRVTCWLQTSRSAA